MRKLNDIFLLAKKTVTDPAGAAAGLSAPGAGSGGPLVIYLASCAAYALLLYTKPSGFPADLAEAAAEFSGRSYAWLLTVHTCSGLAFTAAFCAAFAFFSGFMTGTRQEGSRLIPGGRILIFRFMSGCAACGIYAAAAFYFKRSPLLALPFLLIALAAGGIAVSRSARPALAFFRFTLAAGAAELICLPACFLAVRLRSEQLFIVTALAGALWTMVLSIKAAKFLFGGTAVRAALSMLFAAAAVMISFYILKNIGVIPAGIFRFLMFM
jgi:hypothetical protein